MITLEEAKRKQEKLQQAGKEMLEHFGIIECLSQLGKVEIEGSYAIGLMVKADVDITVISEDPDLDKISETAQKFIRNKDLNRVMVTSKYMFRHDGTPGRPPGIYLGLCPFWKDEEWNLDIWIMSKEARLDVDNFAPDWHTKLSADQKDIMLLLKHQLYELGRYPGTKGDKFASADIYRAVMNDNVKTIAELEEWRKTHPYY